MLPVKNRSTLHGLCSIVLVCLGVVVLLVLSPLHESTTYVTETAAGEEVIEIAPGTSVHREISGGARDVFELPVNEGSLLRFSINKGDLGLTTAVYGTTNSGMVEHRSEDFEVVELSVPVDVSGTYRIEIQSREKVNTLGPYELKIESLTPLSPTSRKDSEAQQTMMRAGVLRASWKKAALIQARDEYDKAALMWTSTGNFRNASQALLKSGDVYFLLAEYSEALKRYRNAVTLASRTGAHLTEAKALGRMARLYSYTGKNDLAQNELSKALKLLGSPDAGASPIAANTHGEVLTILGEVTYARGNMSKASDQFKLASQLLQGDRKGEARVHLFNGYIAGSIGMPDKALAEASEAFTLYQATHDQSGEGLALTLLGLFPSFKGQQDQAIDLHQKAIGIFQSIGDHYGEAVAINALGQAHLHLNDYKTALSYTKQALQIFHERGVLDLEPVAAFKVAQLYLRMNQYEPALSFFERCLELSRSAGKVRTETNALTDIATVYAAQGRSREALDQYQKVLKFYEAIDDRRGQAVVLNARGDFLLKSGKKEEAAKSFQRALTLAEEATDTGILIKTFYNLARAERALGHLDRAFSLIDRSLKVIEELRNDVGSPDLRASYFSGTRKNYELCTQILIDLDKAQPGKGFAAKALVMSEKSRSRSLVDLVRESGAGLRRDAPKDLLNRERELRGLIQRQAQYQVDLKMNRTDVSEIDEVENKILELKSQYQQIQAQIREQNPRALSLAQFEPLTLEQIQSELRDDDLLLEFSLGDERSHLWAVTTNSVQHFELPDRKTIEEQSVNVYKLVTTRQEIAEQIETFNRHVDIDKSDQRLAQSAASLSEILFGQVAAQLGNRRLVLVIEGALQLVPFDALPVPFASVTPETTPRYLLADHEIVQLPSIATLRAIRAFGKKDREIATKVAAVLADPVFTVSDDRVRRSSLSPAIASAAADANRRESAQTSLDGLRSSGPARLTHASEEADAIEAVAPRGTTVIAKGFDATREMAMNSRLGEYQILHFATHGFLDDEHPELSGIVLTMVDKNGVEKNGVMPLHDIYSLDLSAELTVLSACQTALGKDVTGEGIVGLTHSFISAGSKSVVASLWKVDDRATATLMESMYLAMLQQGMSPAGALRAAKLKVMQDKRWNHPYFWAGFTVQGEYTNHINVENNSSRRLGVIVIMSLLLISCGLIVFKVRHRRGSFFARRT